VPLAAVMMTRVRLCVPVPQDFVHVVKAVQLPMTHSVGHGFSLQLRVSSRYGQAYPPCWCAATWLRDRLCVPVSQLAVHVVQAEKDDTEQCTGQACVLQLRVSFRYGHAYPPNSACVITVRDRLCDPVPHDLVQVL